MASLAKSFVRLSLLRPSPIFRACLHTSSRRLNEEEKDMDQLQQNPYYAKYADKIAKLQNTSPEEFLDRLNKMEEKKQDTANVQERDFSLPTKAKKTLNPEASMQKRKKLDDVMKLDLIKDKTAEEITSIWKEHFLAKKSLSAIIPKAMYHQMREMFQLHKTFLLPLPRKNGYEFFVVQFSGDEAHFTSLINFQAFSENAPECMTLVHYTDLADSKDIVLMVGEFDGNILSIQEAQCLANQVEMYYCNPSATKRSLLETFTQKPQEFKHQDLVAQLENISLLTESAK